jgi:hypothetical protein
VLPEKRQINLRWLLQSVERRTFLLRTTTYPGLHLAHLGHLEGGASWVMFIPGSRELEEHAGAAVRVYFHFSKRLSSLGTLMCTFVASRAPTSPKSCHVAEGHS